MILLKTDYNVKITEIENKVPDISNLATQNAVTTVDNKKPTVSRLATKSALTATENKFPDVSNFAAKTAQANVTTKRNFDAKIIEPQNNIKNYKHLIRAILEVKVILKKIVHEII